MKKFASQNVRVGMRFSLPVFFEDGKNMFLAEGIAVSEHDIEALRHWKIAYLYTEGHTLSLEEIKTLEEKEASLDVLESVDDVSSVEDLEEVAPLQEVSESPANSEVKKKSPIDESTSDVKKNSKAVNSIPTTEKLKQTYTSCVDELENLFSVVRNNAVLQRRSVDDLTERVFLLLDEFQDKILEFLLSDESTDKQLAKSGINTCVLSILMGRHVGLNPVKQKNLAIAGVLHDIGMAKVPEEILAKTGSLTQEELKIIHSHPSYSHKIIVKDLLYPEEVGAIAQQHHERWDGTGYPSSLVGKAILPGARILAIVDAYIAMICKKSYRGSMIGYHAIKSLLNDNSRRFDPDMLKSFIQCMGLYPVGSLVLLNDSSVARVVEGHNEAPLRPKIRILIDEYGNAYSGNSGNIIDLQKNRTYFIARALDPKEYRSS